MRGRKAVAVPGADLDERPLAVVERAKLELCTPSLDVPRLVLDLVVLERERLACLHEQELPAVVVGERPDQLPAPRLLDPPRLDGVLAHAASHSGFAATCSSARRSSFGVFTVSHRPSCRYAPQPTLGGELREGSRLVVATVGEAPDRLGREHVDAAVHPVRIVAGLREPRDDVVVSDLDDGEPRSRTRDRNRCRRSTLTVPAEQRGEIDVDQLVAVQRVDVACLRALSGRELDPAAATEALGLLGTDDLRAQSRRVRRRTLLPARRRTRR